MPKQPEELLASPPLIFCPPPRRTYDCLTDGDTDCVEPRRSVDSFRSARRQRSGPRSSVPAATNREGKSSSSSAKLNGSGPSAAAGPATAPKLKRKVSTQKHSKQDLQTQASSEDFSATYWQELNESGEELRLTEEIEVEDLLPDDEVEDLLPDDEVEDLLSDDEAPLQEILLQDLRRQGTAAMHAFQTAMAEGTEPLHSVKLCLVGHARAGKTSTLRSLSGREFDPNQQSTHGVETKSCTLDKELWSPGTEETSAWQELSEGLGSVAKLFEEKVALTVADTMKAQANHGATCPPQGAVSHSQALDRGPKATAEGTTPVLGDDTVLLIQRAISSERGTCQEREQVVLQTWDFAGQEMYYNMAHVFLTALGIYVLVLDLSAWCDATPVEKVESMDFWLAALLVHAKDAWLVIVGSHADAIDESIRQEVYQRLDVHLQKRLQHQRLLGNEAHGLLFFPIDNQQNTPESLRSIQHLRREVSNLAWEVSEALPRIPTRWAHFFHQLEGLQEPCISLDRCRSLAAALAMDATDLELFLGLFHRLGQLLYFKGSPAVVLTPQWLLDAMAQVVACPLVLKTDPIRSKALREQGRLQKDLLEVLWKDPKFQSQELVLQSFLEHFDLLIPMEEDQGGWLVPSLLPRRPEKMIPLDQPVSVLLDFKGAFRRLLTTLIPRLLCQLRKRPVIAEIPWSQSWRTTLDIVMKGRKSVDYDLHDRHGLPVLEVNSSLDSDRFPLELRHRKELRVHKMFRDFAKFTLGSTLVTFELVPRHSPEVLRLELGSKDARLLKDVLDSLHVAICAWLPDVSYSTGLPCPCGIVESGHFLELNRLLKEETIYCDQSETLVKPRSEEEDIIRHWRQLERGEDGRGQPCTVETVAEGGMSVSSSTPKQSRTWHFMYASPLEWRQQRVKQLSIAQELDALSRDVPWQVALATPHALLNTLQEKPLVLHLSAHSALVAPKGGGGESRRALLLEDAYGAGDLLDIQQLLQLGPWEDVELLMLLSCNSKQLVEMLNCRCAVCCIGEVRDAAARHFCSSFYQHLLRGAPLSDAFRVAQDAVRWSDDAGLRGEAEKFCLLGGGHLLDLNGGCLTSVENLCWPRHSRVEDFRCQASQMVRMAKCLSSAEGHRRVILLLGAQGAGKTATCREFCHHFAGPGRLFSGRVLFLDSQELRAAGSTTGGSMEDFLCQALQEMSTRSGQGLSLLVIDNLHIFEDSEKTELRSALEGALRFLDSLRVLLTSRCTLEGCWDFLEHGKIVWELTESLPKEDAAELFLRRCKRPLYPSDFKDNFEEPEPARRLPRELAAVLEGNSSTPLKGTWAHQLLAASQLLKALDGVPGRIIRAACAVDQNLSSLAKHPVLSGSGHQ